MKEIPLPQTEEAREKKRAALRRARKALSALSFAAAVAAILCLLSALIAVVVIEFRSENGTDLLLYELLGAFAGGAVLFGAAGALLAFGTKRFYLRELDFCERCDGEKSFYVGEGTLASFGAGHLRIRGEKKGAEVRVPYGALRFFSVCVRTRPCEKGEWSVVIEIPTRYLAKEGKAKEGEPPALVQTDAKERLQRCLKEEGLALLGELPAAASSEKFLLLKKFSRPDAKKRRRALMFAAVGAVLFAAAVPVALLWDISVGAILGVFGAFVLGRALYSFCRAKSALVFYREGLWWRDSVRADSVFLKWEEVESVTREEKEIPLLTVRCAYGSYHFADVAGAYAFLQETFPEKCGKER